MEISVCTIAYNEREWIERCIEQFRPFIKRHVVLVSSKPWQGSPELDDGTAGIARDAGAEVYVQYWKTEAEQRNWGLARLYDSDYVLIVDADELYARTSIEEMLAILKQSRHPSFRVHELRTYWKTKEYVCDPLESWETPAVAVDPKQVKFRFQRTLQPIAEDRRHTDQPFLPVTLHHMSWVKSDSKVREKLQSFSHADIVHPGWFENVWLRWTPEMENIAPYGDGPMRAVYAPCPPLDR